MAKETRPRSTSESPPTRTPARRALRRLGLSLLAAVAGSLLTSPAAQGAGPIATTGAAWTGTWATALTTSQGVPGFPGFENESVRMIVQTSIGGTQVRVRLSNVHGDRGLTIGRATIARPVAPSVPDLIPDSLRSLTFEGHLSVTIPPGEDVYSDPLAMSVASLSQLAVTLYLPEPTGPPSFHLFARQTAYHYAGDRTTTPDGAGSVRVSEHFYYVTGIEVTGQPAGGAVAVLGASISDGFGSTVDANTRWPDFLARRLVDASGSFPALGVLNVSLSGNALNHDGIDDGLIPVGPKAIDRLDEHVRPHAGLRTVIVDLGLNDIFRADDPPAVIVDGLRTLTAELRRRGYRVVLATLTPAAAAPNWNSRRETTRQLVNHYIRTNREGVGVFDADLALRDPSDPTRVYPPYAIADGVHPNDAGAQVLAEALRLSLL